MNTSIVLFIILNVLFYALMGFLYIFPLYFCRDPIGKLKKPMGKKLLSFKSAKIMNKKNISLSLISCLIMYISLIIQENKILAFTALGLQILTLLCILYKYSKSAGVYENGIIYGDHLYWDKIHSWKTEDNGKISLLLKNGFNITIEEDTDTEILSQILTDKI
ncbi:hypothetical protein [Treponema pedis]|uniref:DUF5673 domain-containing protein n=1 Tax=Treponema pedis str. T A4 TaxID=1291379 RepID=S5ZPF5_9SPIR|nr:hypothetical protein [Treponema pedis]AGT44507.1 hypothetical protein TPE_2033 [Treponema pedis str. T A4]